MEADNKGLYGQPINEVPDLKKWRSERPQWRHRSVQWTPSASVAERFRAHHHTQWKLQRPIEHPMMKPLPPIKKRKSTELAEDPISSTSGKACSPTEIIVSDSPQVSLAVPASPDDCEIDEDIEEMRKDIEEEEACKDRWIFARADEMMKKTLYRAAKVHRKEAEANLVALIVEKYPEYKM